jgi:hypothetical protein
VEVPVDILCVCSLAESKSAIVLVDEKRLRTIVFVLTHLDFIHLGVNSLRGKQSAGFQHMQLQ